MGRGHAGRRSREPRLLSGWVAIRVEAKHASRRGQVNASPLRVGRGLGRCLFVCIRSLSRRRLGGGGSIRGSGCGLW